MISPTTGSRDAAAQKPRAEARRRSLVPAALPLLPLHRVFFMDNYSLLYSSAHRSTLLAGLQRLRSDGKMCDVVLETGGVSFPCHRALLASSSDYFWALFGETTAERRAGRVSLPALTPDGLAVVLDFLYSGWLSVSASSLPAVLEAARYLQVEAGVSICQRFMIDSLSLENCCGYANLAAQHALTEALEASNRTIAMETGRLLQRSRADLLGLNLQSLTSLFDADEIPAVREAELVRLALDWLEENGPLPLLQSNLLLSRLRFGLVAPSDLAILGHAHRAMATPLIRSQLTRALEYHRMGSAQPITQSRQTALRAAPDQVLLVGGSSRPDQPGRQLLTFDPRSRKFSPLSCCLPLRLRKHAVCSVGGFLFVLGGELASNEEDEKSVALETSNQVWRFDPRFDQWEQAAPLLERRAQFSCCVLNDNIHVIGGQREDAPVASTEFYDMATGVWRRGAAMPRPLYGHASATLDNCIYVSGGCSGSQGSEANSGSRDVLCLEPGDRKWVGRASMSIGRFAHRMASAHSFLYALLGMYEPFCDIERYEPRSDHWTRLRPLLSGSFAYGLVTTASESLLLFGGRKWSDGQEVVVRSVMEYDTRKDQWREICQLPRALSGTECTMLPLPD